MKKILFSISILLLFASCSNNDNSTTKKTAITKPVTDTAKPEQSALRVIAIRAANGNYSVGLAVFVYGTDTLYVASSATGGTAMLKK